MDGDEQQAVDEATRTYGRAVDAYGAAMDELRAGRVAWREYAAAALQGAIAARLVPLDERYRADGLAYAAEIADDMLALERARFGGPGGVGDR
jgi:hypothetical protein